MRPPTSPVNQGVTFVELFFDLAFVFAVNKTVSMFHHGFDWGTIAQATVTFWLVWWAWTQFTWTLNAADTTHPVITGATLAATAIAFFIAVAIPDAFHGHAVLFAVPYVLIRLTGLVLFRWVASADKLGRQGVPTFAFVSVCGLVAVTAGAIAGGTTQQWLWGLAVLLDIVALMTVARSESWTIHPAHFCERHGLFVVIALGESLIVSAIGMKKLTETLNILTVGPLVILTSCGMWWLYFARLKPAMDRAMESSSGAKLSGMARDAYSLVHFLILGGILAFAIAVEHAFAHPGDPIGLEIRIAAAFAVALYGIGTVLAFLRTTGRLLVSRLILTLVTFGTIVLSTGLTPLIGLSVGFVAIVVVAIVEQRSLVDARP